MLKSAWYHANEFSQQAKTTNIRRKIKMNWNHLICYLSRFNTFIIFWNTQMKKKKFVAHFRQKKVPLSTSTDWVCRIRGIMQRIDSDQPQNKWRLFRKKKKTITRRNDRISTLNISHCDAFRVTLVTVPVVIRCERERAHFFCRLYKFRT